MDFSVVIPVKNEADNIRPLLSEIRGALDGRCEYEVIYVDDGSDDATLQELQALMKQFPQLRTLRHARNCGQSTGLRTGVRAARADWVITLDGDGQNDPADIPNLIDRLRDPARPQQLQLIMGHRAKRQDSWLRRFSSRVANRVRAALLKDATPDSGCGLKLFSRQAFLELPFFDHMHRFLPALFQRNGGTVVSVRVNHRPRTRGASKYGLHNRLWVGITDLFGVMWLLRRAKLPQVREVLPDTTDPD